MGIDDYPGGYKRCNRLNKHISFSTERAFVGFAALKLKNC